ncbi:hypothetical protein PV-S19_0168 [Pacmanvirus S19]|nr:hypothetical protein PV-S19_0168 [Pacmanvirus S19]
MCDATTKKLCSIDDCINCLNRSFASHPKSIHWSNKNIVKSREVFKCSSKKYWFICGTCNHEFDASPNKITRVNSSWCPYCSIPTKKLCDNDNCEICFNNSFLSHERSEFWSARNIISPRKAFKNSNTKYWFDCDCGHEFEMSLNNIMSITSKWCPYCANQKLCDSDSCELCFNKSFLSHRRSEFWSAKNILSPREVFKGSNNKYWFDCICGHEFEIIIKLITNKMASWCSYCNNKKLCNKDNCEQCFNKSFASQPESKYWAVENTISPREVFKNSGLKFWFTCELCGHNFDSKLYNITSNNHWCPCVKNKTEAKLFDIIKSHGYDITKQMRVGWCRSLETNKYLPFDFQIEEYKIIIELDGGQHFKQVSNWKPPKEQQKRDKYKMDCANNQGYTVIRIFQEDVWLDTINWLEEIEKYIYLHPEPTRIYISSGNHYDVY